MTVRPRSGDKATCFVEAQVLINLPTTYPAEMFPVVEVKRCSGLIDDGRRLCKRVVKIFREEAVLGGVIITDFEEPG